MTSLNGKIIVVTGASAGIGFAIAETLAKQGAKVVAVARNVEKIQDLSKRLGGCAQITAIKADMTKEAEVLALFKEVGQKFGKLDVLINNAGMAASEAELTDGGSFKSWKDVLDLNVLALTLATREGVKLIESGGSKSGHVIQLNSILGHGTAPTGAGIQFYAATKHMVTALTEGLRKSVQAKNIRVTSLSPGVVETEITERAHGKEASKAFYSQYKVLEPKDIADAVVYILTAPPHVNIDELTITPLQQQAL